MLEFVQFLLSVLSAHFILSGGCVLTVLVGLYEKYWKKQSVSLKAYGRVILVLFVFACFQSWQQEHESRVGRERDLHNQEAITARKSSEADTEKFRRETCGQEFTEAQNQLNHAQGMLDGRLDQVQDQQNTLHQQQTTFASCILALTKSNTAEPLSIKTLMVDTGIKGAHIGEKTMNAFVVIGMTNQPITPIRATLECQYPFEAVGSAAMAFKSGEDSSQLMFAGGRRPTSTKMSAQIDAPASWNPTDLLTFPIVAVPPGPGVCHITRGL